MSEELKNEENITGPVSRINQQAIADRLGVSRTTVSRCFTNHAGISPVTRARVFDLASQIGYRHMEMRGTRRKGVSAGKVGVLVCAEMERIFHSDYETPRMELYSGLSEFAQINKLDIELFHVDPSETSLDAASYARIAPLRKREWDGVMLIHPFPRGVVDEIDMKFPMVAMTELYDGREFNCVDVDRYRGISMIIDRLRALGHERIGFYTRPYLDEAGWSFRRFAAFIEKLARHGVQPFPGDIVNVYPGCMHPDLEQSCQYIIARIRQGVSAWVCAADYQAYELIAALRKAGLRVPHDVSLTGFDGIRKPDWAPVLTTAVVPYWEIGYTSGRRLMDLMKKRFDSPQHILVAPRMIEGETIGPAAHRMRVIAPGQGDAN